MEKSTQPIASRIKKARRRTVPSDELATIDKAMREVMLRKSYIGANNQSGGEN
jgi:hypothetical protein